MGTEPERFQKVIKKGTLNPGFFVYIPGDMVKEAFKYSKLEGVDPVTAELVAKRSPCKSDRRSAKFMIEVKLKSEAK